MMSLLNVLAGSRFAYAKRPGIGAALLLLAAIPAFAQTRTLSHRRIVEEVDESRQVRLAANTHRLVHQATSVTSAPGDLAMDSMLLVLRGSPEQEAALTSLLANQQDPTSPDFHNWITPEEFGRRFGPADEDVQTVVRWLQSHGFRVDNVAKGKMSIEFSGVASQVETAFRTSIGRVNTGGGLHWANLTDPAIPAALAPVVVGVSTLHDFHSRPQLAQPGAVPLATLSGGSHALSPGDYAVIYNIKPLYSAGITGAGATVAIVGRSNINLQDVIDFRRVFGLSANPPQIIVNGVDPGDLGGGEELEALLDVSWAGATGPGATVKFVVSKSTPATDGVDLSERYIITNNIAGVMSESFGNCEANYTSAQASLINSMAMQAASQGITYLVSSGDSGSAGCDAPSKASATGPLSVNMLASSPYVMAVGGTQFNENTGTYWSSQNTGSFVSALSYIPENVWNQSCASSACSSPSLYAGSGGVSTYFAKPSWQAGVAGIPSDGMRDLPDVSLTAATHDPYMLCRGGSCSGTSTGFTLVGGTSASAPSMAGIMTLINQKQGRQGQANTVLYKLAAQQQYSQCNGSSTSAQPSSSCVFYDTTAGNNAVPGESGYGTTHPSYVATTAYDLATGLGSINVNNLVNAWAGATTTAYFTLSATSAGAQAGGGGSSTVTVTGVNGFNSSVTLATSNWPTGITGTFGTNPTANSSVAAISVNASVAAGTYSLVVNGTSGTLAATTNIVLTVTTTGNTGNLPYGVSVTPSAGSGTASTAQNLQFAWASPAGQPTLSASTVLIQDSTTAAPASGATSFPNACTFNVYSSGAGVLADDSGSTANSSNIFYGNSWSISASNSHCGINGPASAIPVQSNGGASEQATINLTFNSIWAGRTLAIWLQATNSNYKSGAWQQFGTFTVVAGGSPNFTLSATSASAPAGGSGTSTVTVNPSNGFSSAVTLATSGWPSGITGAFGTNPTTNSSVVTIAVSSGVAAGSYTLTVTGTSGSLSASTTIALTVTAAPSFTLSATPASAQAGGTGTSTVTVNRQSGFSSPVTLTTSGWPSGITGSFGTNPATTSSVVTINVSSGVAAGTYTLIVNGTSGSLSASTTIPLTVTAAPTFTLSATSASAQAGASGTSTVTVNGQNGFNSSVTLAASGWPSGITGSFGTNPTTSSSVVTINVGSSVAAGSYSLTVNGTSGSLSAGTAIALTVTASGSGGTLPYGVSVTPSAGSGPAGAAQNLQFAWASPAGQPGLAWGTILIQDSTAAAPTNGSTAFANACYIIVNATGSGQLADDSGSEANSSNIWFGNSWAISPANAHCGVNGPASQFPVVSSNAASEQVTINMTFNSSWAGRTVAIWLQGTNTNYKAGTWQQFGTFTVGGGAAPTFTLSATSASAQAGASGTSTVTVNGQNGFNSSVTLAASGWPSGITGSFETNPTTSSSVVTINVGAGVAAGSYSLIVNGASGSLSASTTIALTVKGPGSGGTLPYGVSVTPSAGSGPAGAAQNLQFAWASPAGQPGLAWGTILIQDSTAAAPTNGSTAFANACYIIVNATGSGQLADDSGSEANSSNIWFGNSWAISPANAHCGVNGPASQFPVVSSNAASEQVTINMTFNSSWAGRTVAIWLQGTNTNYKAGAWQQFGTFTVTSAGAAATLSSQ